MTKFFRFNQKKFEILANKFKEGKCELTMDSIEFLDYQMYLEQKILFCISTIRE